MGMSFERCTDNAMMRILTEGYKKLDEKGKTLLLLHNFYGLEDPTHLSLNLFLQKDNIDGVDILHIANVVLMKGNDFIVSNREIRYSFENGEFTTPFFERYIISTLVAEVNCLIEDFYNTIESIGV